MLSCGKCVCCPQTDFSIFSCTFRALKRSTESIAESLFKLYQKELDDGGHLWSFSPEFGSNLLVLVVVQTNLRFIIFQACFGKSKQEQLKSAQITQHED